MYNNFNFKHTWPQFNNSYGASISKFGELPFVSVYSMRGEVNSKTFKGFDLDVQKAQITIQAELNNSDQVVTFGTNQYWHLVSIVACWSLGLPHCPINPHDTKDRIERRLDRLGGQSLCLEIDNLGNKFSQIWIHSCSSTTKVRTHHSDNTNLMGLIFTSGSTGELKIVELEAEQIFSNVDSLIDHHHLGPHRILCTSLPIFHVNALYFSFLSSLLSGTKLILMESFIAPQIWEVIQDEKVQILSLVPQLIRYMLREKPSPKSFNLSSLEYIVSAAAPLSQSLVQKFHETFAKKVIQGYGLSEAVNFSCTFPTQCDKSTYQELVLDSKIPSIGTALACNEVVILDRLGKECKQPYIEGEIAIRGANVMRSYRGETNSTQNSNNMLVTGDLGYFIRNKKGEKFFFISGRIKDIIKKNGFTLSLREVDDIISEFEPESIQGIAVPFKGHEEAEDFGIVLSLQHPNQNIDLGDLEKRLYLYLVSKLPQYLRPSVAILVNQPVFAKNGKVIRPPFAKLFDNFINQNIGRSIRIFDRRDT